MYSASTVAEDITSFRSRRLKLKIQLIKKKKALTTVLKGL